MSKTSRQHRIVQLLAEVAVSSQTQLVELLEAEGIEALRNDKDRIGKKSQSTRKEQKN